MADDFRILTSGSELSGNGDYDPNSGGKTNWWLWGMGIAATVVIIAAGGYYLGRNSVISPTAAAANDNGKSEKETANGAAAKNAVIKTS